MKKITETQEFLNNIKIVKNDILKIHDGNKAIINALSNCCTLCNESGREIVKCDLIKLLDHNASSFKSKLLIKVLQTSLGEDGYKDENLLKVLSAGYGIYNGKVMNKPNSYEEVVMLLNTYNDILQDEKEEDMKKSKYASIINAIEIAIANKSAESIRMVRETSLVINNFDIIINGLANNKLVKIENENMFYELLKYRLSVKNVDGSVNEEFSSSLKEFIEEYNSYLKKLIDDKPYQNKLNKYFKKITRTPFEKLDYSKFPKFEDENFLRYMDDLRPMIEEKLKEDESLINTYSVFMIRKADYYKIKNTRK